MNDNSESKKQVVEIDNDQGSKPDLRRRNALLGAATGASLIAWHKPIITAVVLPAHAQTSGVAAAFFPAGDLLLGSGCVGHCRRAETGAALCFNGHR